MQIPEKTFVVHVGGTAVVPAGMPMMLTRLQQPERALVLVLQDESQPWMTKANDWKPTSACPQYVAELIADHSTVATAPSPR